MKYIGMILLLLVLAVVVIGDFTDINSAQYYGKTKDKLRATAIDANFELVKAQTDTNVTIDATLYTPDFIGQALIGSVSNTVFIAGGTTTNDWISVNDPS